MSVTSINVKISMKNPIEEIYKIVRQSKGVSIDSRTIKPGQIFFALSGDNFDGNKFTNQAFQNGALKAVVSDTDLQGQTNTIYVENTLLTLQEVAGLHRLNFDIPIVALTGTNGKTTTKELTSHLLSSSYNTLCTQGNLNNHIGVPLTLLNIDRNHEIAVIEMGASGTGEIMDLCKIARPTHGLITSIGKAHLEGFGSFENIVKTKTELYEYLRNNDGIFFYNTVVKEFFNILNNKNFNRAESFNNEDFRGRQINSIERSSDKMYIELKIRDNKGKINSFQTSVYGQYNFINIVNACKIADHFNVNTEKIIQALKEFIPGNNRSQMTDWRNNTLILDAYNANPTSVMEAILSFEKIEDRRNKIIILGDMLELGESSLFEHRNVISHLLQNNIYSKIIFVGSQFSIASDEFVSLSQNCSIFQNSWDAGKFLADADISNSLILAKGSRGIKIESVFL